MFLPNYTHLQHFGHIQNTASENEILIKNFQSSILDDSWELFTRMFIMFQKFKNESIFTISVEIVRILLSLLFQLSIRLKSRTTNKGYGTEGPVATCLLYFSKRNWRLIHDEKILKWVSYWWSRWCIQFWNPNNRCEQFDIEHFRIRYHNSTRAMRCVLLYQLSNLIENVRLPKQDCFQEIRQRSYYWTQ